MDPLYSGERLTVEEADEIVAGVEDAEGMVNYECKFRAHPYHCSDMTRPRFLAFIKRVMAGPFPDESE